MANPRSLVYALYTHWDTVEVLVRLSREFAVLTTEQVLGCIAKVAPQLDAEAQGAALRAMVNADILNLRPQQRPAAQCLRAGLRARADSRT
jgi:hypothetical protein